MAMDELDTPAAAAPRLRHAWLLKLALEVVLIGIAVFLALLTDEWRERARNRDVASEALLRFKTELLANRSNVQRVAPYHAEMQPKIDAYLNTAPAARDRSSIRLSGLRPAWFEHTAWDLALATGALQHIDADTAFALARVYNNQQAYAGLTQGLLNAMYMRPPAENLDAFLGSVDVYYDDIVTIEPNLLQLYDDAVARINAALGAS
jgi:hypothetical protein